MKRKYFLVAFMLLSTSVLAGAKDDFISAVVSQCGKSNDEAAAMATPGRSGNVIKLKTCTSSSVTIGDCKLKCTDASSAIGGK